MNFKGVLHTATIFSILVLISGEKAFEKVTELDYRGNTYYTIRNLTMWECHGWCREEPECAAASFSHVLNPLAPVKETLCLLQNETLATNPSAAPQRAVSLYYMVKLNVRSEKVCNRPWTFERVPNSMIKGLDNALIFTSTKEACLAACLNEERFICRSCEYNYVTLQCHLSEHDRRSIGEEVDLTEVQGVDYFENLCLTATESCKGERVFKEPQFGVPNARVALYVDLHYYVDKGLMANSVAACEMACLKEEEFLCRSFLFKGPPSGESYNCRLFHLDHFVLPDGPSTYLSTDRPLLDNGEVTGQYYENICQATETTTGEGSSSDSSGTSGGGSGATGGGGGSTSASSGETGIESSSQIGSQYGNLDLTGLEAVLTPPNGGLMDHLFGADTDTDTDTDTSDSYAGYPTITTPKPISGQEDNVNCDPTGICYNVSVHCKDTRIVVRVGTTKPFNGRIYSLGRSETCNVDVINSDEFRLDLTMEGQDCNTQSAGGVFTNTIVIQHNSVVMTKKDKIYKIRCTYDMSSKNITFGMMPIRDPAMIPITSAPEAPAPRIRILDENLNEVETVRIGDKLTFRIEIPEETPYGIFARSCVAMAKDSRSTFQIIDDDGCPVEPTIFPHFVQVGSALQAVYEAFRFTESYGVIFQCNVKYCLGECQAAKCRTGTTAVWSYGRKKRGLRSSNQQRLGGSTQDLDKDDSSDKENVDSEEMSISQEILVLDLGDEQSPQYKKSSRPSVEENFFTNTTFKLEHPEVTLFETCPTRSSVLALAVTCAILLLIYVLTVFYFVMRKWSSPPKHVH